MAATYNFGLLNGSLILESFERIGFQPAALAAHHMLSAQRSLNLTLLDWSNKGTNLWDVTQGTITLAPPQATYVLPANLVTLLNVWYSTNTPNGGTGPLGLPVSTDRYLTPMTREEYAELPNKSTPGPPTQFWYQFTSPPQVTFWPVPNVASPTVNINWFGLQQPSDALIGGANAPDVLYRGLSALASDLAVRLFTKFYRGPEATRAARRAELIEDRAMTWDAFCARDQEMGTATIRPDFTGWARI